MISRPCRTAYQSSPSSAIPCFPRDSLCAYRRPCCDVTAVSRLWSSTSSLPTYFPLDHTLHQLAPAVSDGVSKEGEFVTYNKSYRLYGVSIRFRSNGSLFNLARLRSQSKCMTTLLHEFQYADDCALIADSEEALQDYIDSFADTASSFGLTINCKKTEVMALQNSAVRNPLSVNGTHLANVHSFKYLGSTVTDDCRMDKELDCRIQCATTSFGRLWDRLWSSHDISNKTKISVYKAAITSALLFGAETSSSVSHIPTESPMIKSLTELACPILR